MQRDALVPSLRLKINEAPFGHGGAGEATPYVSLHAYIHINSPSCANSASCDAECHCCAASGPPLTPDAVASFPLVSRKNQAVPPAMLRLLYCLPHSLALIGSPPHVRRPHHPDPFLRCIRYPHVARHAVLINANVSFCS
ncbi:hypothetical protein FB451DRAFT_1565489, partial [Mycena latifolia]